MSRHRHSQRRQQPERTVRPNPARCPPIRLWVRQNPPPRLNCERSSTLRRAQETWLSAADLRDGRPPESAPREPVALEDVLREEAASPLPPAETEIDRGAEPAGPNDQTTSQRTQNNGDDEDHVPMVDNVAADPSPADEPTLAPTLPTATDEEGTTKPELVAADPTMDEATEPKAKITSPGSTRSKQGRSGGRQLKKQKLPAEISERGRKCSPTRMRLFLDSIAECPIKTQAAKKGRCSPQDA